MHYRLVQLYSTQLSSNLLYSLGRKDDQTSLSPTFLSLSPPPPSSRSPSRSLSLSLFLFLDELYYMLYDDNDDDDKSFI